MDNLNNISLGVNFIKNLMIVFATQVTIQKIINDKEYFSISKIIRYISFILMEIVVQIVNVKIGFVCSIIILIFWISCISMIFTKGNIGYNILITTISLAFNYSTYFISLIIVFFINNKIVIIENDIINLILIMLIDAIILYNVFKMKKFKYGIISLQNKFDNQYMENFILMLSVGILYMTVIFANKQFLAIKNVMFIFIIFAALMFITIQKSLQLYYKQKMLIKELDETKEDLARAENKIKILEKENIEESKKRHTIIHK